MKSYFGLISSVGCMIWNLASPISLLCCSLFINLSQCLAATISGTVIIAGWLVFTRRFETLTPTTLLFPKTLFIHCARSSLSLLGNASSRHWNNQKTSLIIWQCDIFAGKLPAWLVQQASQCSDTCTKLETCGVESSKWHNCILVFFHLHFYLIVYWLTYCTRNIEKCEFEPTKGIKCSFILYAECII